MTERLYRLLAMKPRITFWIRIALLSAACGFNPYFFTMKSKEDEGVDGQLRCIVKSQKPQALSI